MSPFGGRASALSRFGDGARRDVIWSCKSHHVTALNRVPSQVELEFQLRLYEKEEADREKAHAW